MNTYNKIWGWALVALVGAGASGCADESEPRFRVPTLGSDDAVIHEIDQQHELRAGVLSLPFVGDVDILYAVVDGRAIWAGDIVLPEDYLQGFRAASTTRLWPEGTVKYVFDASLPAQARLGVLQAMDQWTIRSGIRFREVQPQGGGHLLIKRGAPSDCSAHIGYFGTSMVHELNLGEKCDQTHVYTHELGHVIGLFHEQSRSDRDQHVTIVWDNVKEGFASAFDKYEKNGAGEDRGAYDFASIMHYASYNFAVDPTKPTLTRMDGGIIELPVFISGADAMAVQAMYANQPQGQAQGQDGAADDPGGQGDGCTGHCGSLEPTAANCYCDAGCAEYGDCCADQQTVCGGGDGNQPEQPVTCAGQCDASTGQPDANGVHCYCDAACLQNGDCCSDYAMHCGGDDGGGDSSTGTGGGDGGSDGGVVATCVNHCDGWGSQGETCWCDGKCADNGDCCPDYGMACGGGGGGSCVGNCNNLSPVDDCYCEPGCVDLGDCCADYVGVCG